MSSNLSRPTSPPSPGTGAAVVRDKLKLSAVHTNTQTGRKSLPLLSTTHKTAYRVFQGHLEQCTDHLPEPPKGKTGRRLSRSLPLSEKSRRRFPIGRRLQLPRRRRQRPTRWNFPYFGEAMELRDGQDRRLQAQHSRERHESCELDAHAAHSPHGIEAISSLAKAGMTLATGYLDRLSERARAHREESEER
ncbi:hypothetical protein E4U42_003218 [Claviceps africana]|uniref:Uncharacterized protein n=1 Tax=Claviceps africana TaxID=83212 RepID=A0A8K0NPB8_9HYPO|nr:hypothetical protein E4U42_003218 [Claviceps africana]